MTDNLHAEAIDRLCTALAQLDNDCRCAPHVFYRQALHIVAALAGLLPRRVSSEAELDALPMHSIVRLGKRAYQAMGSGWFITDGDPTYSEAILDLAEDEPVFVLWTPPAEGVQQ